MLNIPDTIKSVISNEYTVKNHRIEFLDIEKADLTNKNLVYDSFSFDESVCSQDQFAFGLSEASSVQFETVDIDDDHKVGNILDQRIRVSLEYKLTAEQAAEVAGDQNLHEREDIGGYWYTIPIGIFYVEECPRNHENMTHRQVTAYSRNERNFNINLAGVYKEDSFAFQPDLLMRVPTIKTSDMTRITYRDNMSIKTGWNSAASSMFYLNGGASGYRYYTGTISSTDKVFVVRAEYTEDDFDKAIALDMMNLAVSKLPSGASSYTYADWTPTEKVYSSGSTAVLINSGCMQPCIDLILYDYEDNKTVYSYPIFVKPGKNILIDPSQLLPSYKPNGYSSANVKSCRIEFRIITKWFNGKRGSSGTAFPTQWFQSYSDNREDKGYTDFSNDWPVDQYHERSNVNEINVYYAALDKTEFSSSYVTIKSTLETTKSQLGTYYMFSNAISTEDLLGGYAEANASFLKQNRDGTFELKHLDKSNPISLNDSNTVQNAWWDEYDVEDVGKIRYTYTNTAGEEVTTTYSIDASKKSVYDMTDNFLLKNMLLIPPTAITDPPGADIDKSKNYRFTGSTKTVDGFTWTKGHVYYYLDNAWHDAGKYNKYATMAKILLEKRFVPYIPSMKFTPIDATFANVPYLEAGDAFTFTAKDGTEVSSYIMRQTISGSQKITSQVECVDGQIISREVEDDE